MQFVIIGHAKSLLSSREYLMAMHIVMVLGIFHQTIRYDQRYIKDMIIPFRTQ